jgi:hypothetical protein
MLMPELRVTLPSLRRLSLSCLFPLLLPCLPSPAQEPNPPLPPTNRVADRAVPVESADKRKSVTISRDEYERLKTAARAAAQAEAARSAVVTEAHYTAAVADGTAKIDCRFVVQVLKGPWAEIPLDFGDAAVGLISTGKGTTAFLRGHDNGRFTLAVKEPGRHEIRLELQANVKSQTAGSGFAFSGPPAGISTLDVVVPASGQRITVSPTLVPERAAALNASAAANPSRAAATSGTSRVKGHLAAASKIGVTWQPNVPSDRLQPVFDVDSRTQLRVRENSLVTECRLSYRVQRGRLATLQIVVPAQDRIIDVSGDGGAISGWTVEKQKGMQQIRVALSRPIADRVGVTVRTERDLSDGTVFVGGADGKGQVFGIHAAESSRETGLLVLSHVPQWEVTVPSQVGWVPLESTEIPGEAATRGSQYVRYFHPQTPFSIRVQPVKPRVAVTQNARIALRSSRIEVTSRLQYQVDRIGVSQVSMRLPAGLTVDRVAGEHVKSFAVAGLDGPPATHPSRVAGLDGPPATHPSRVAGSPGVLRVTFDRRVTGKTELTIHAHRGSIEGTKPGELELPLPEPEAVDRESGRIELFAPEAVEVAAVAERTSGVTTATVAPGMSNGGLNPVSAWSYDVRPMRITVNIKQRAPRITARLGTRIDVRESVVGITSDLEFRVVHAPATSFRFAVPATVAGSVRVTDAAGNALAVRAAGPPPASAKKPDAKKSSAADVEWTVLEIEPSQPIAGVYRLKIQYEQELSKPANGGQPLSVQPLRVLGADASELHGEISVARARSLKLTLQARGGDVEPADGRELSFLKAIDGEHFQYHREPVMLSIGISQLNIETVAETVVSRGLVEVLLAGDSNASYRARYRVLSSERQRLRLDLPKSCEPLGVFVNGSPVALERDSAEQESEEWTSYLINVSRTQPYDEAFSLVVQFRMPVKPAPFQVPLGRLRLNLPQIHNPNGSAAVVQQLRTVVWVPEGIALHGEAEGFTRQTATRLTGIVPGGFASRVDSGSLESWIGITPPGVLEFPTQGHAYRFDSVGTVEQLEVAAADMPFATWVLSLPLLLMGLVLARTTWRNRLNLLLLLVFAVTVAAVAWSDATYHALLAARYGLAGALVLWVIHGVLGYRSREQAGATRAAPCPLPIAGLASVVIPPPGLFPEKSRVES